MYDTLINWGALVSEFIDRGDIETERTLLDDVCWEILYGSESELTFKIFDDSDQEYHDFLQKYLNDIQEINEMLVKNHLDDLMLHFISMIAIPQDHDCDHLSW